MDSYHSWLDMDLWRSRADKDLDESDFYGKYPCYLGADLAAVKDLTARVRIYLKDGKFYVFSTFNLPYATANDQSKTNYLRWLNQGYLQTNEGRTIDFNAISQEIYEFIAENPLLKEFAIDKGFTAWALVQNIEKKLEDRFGTHYVDERIVGYGKTVQNFSEPMKQLEKAIVDGTLIHDGNPVMNWCMGNVVVKVDKKENILATKEHEDSKIDGADALITAFARAIMYDGDDYDENDGSLL
jgi:phage terminase large subunit-like protein